MDHTVPQDWASYSEEEHDIWRTLYRRQAAMLPNLACDAFLDGLEKLSLADGIPDFENLSERLSALTGWSVVAVPGLVPDDVFFEHLANRRFPAGRFIRGQHQLDYLQEPDVFHDVFGHVPMLTDPVFADYMQAYGQGGLRAHGMGNLHNLARLYLVHGGVRAAADRAGFADLRRRHSLLGHRKRLCIARPFAAPAGVRFAACDAHAVQDRRCAGGLFRHPVVAEFAGCDCGDGFCAVI